MLIILLFYFVVNLCFATVYYLIGVEHLKGINAENAMDQFGQAFFLAFKRILPSGMVILVRVVF